MMKTPKMSRQMKKNTEFEFGSFSKNGSLPSGHEKTCSCIEKNLQADAFSFFIYDDWRESRFGAKKHIREERGKKLCELISSKNPFNSSSSSDFFCFCMWVCDLKLQKWENVEKKVDAFAISLYINTEISILSHYLHSFISKRCKIHSFYFWKFFKRHMSNWHHSDGNKEIQRV